MSQHVVDQKRNGRRIATAAFAALVVTALAFASASSVSAATNPPGGFLDESAQDGLAPNKTPEEQRAELDRPVEEGAFRISIASVIEFVGPDAAGKAYIQNVPNNHYDLRVDITLSGTGESVYASKGIAPGSYIEDIQLTAALEPGSYDAVATFTAYDRETHAKKGEASANVILRVA